MGRDWITVCNTGIRRGLLGSGDHLINERIWDGLLVA